MITDFFLDQKRVNVCELTVKMAPLESFGKVSQDRKWESGGKIEWKSYEDNTRAVSRGQNKLIGKFKMVAGDVISIREYVVEYTYIPTEIYLEKLFCTLYKVSK